ncbi:hypothetical protein C8R43DRAFT_908036 [Mycena crocata]|nr:hypothetical protein C8R43DRAFT_908036 [Mycena crocata]
MNNTFANAVPNWAQTHPQNRLRPGDPQVRFESPTSTSPPIYSAPFPPHIPIPDTLPSGFVSQTFAPNNHYYSPGLPIPATSAKAKYRHWYRTLRNIAFGIFTFILHSIPQQVYLHILLRVPLLYRSRVDRIFEEARLSEPEIKRMARATAHLWNTNSTAFNRGAHFFSPFMGIASIPKSPNQIPMTSKIQQALPAEISQFRSTWEGFVDSLMQEWHTLNIVSVLLLSAILTMLQIDGAANPITRTSALFSLLCALMSLLYGCMYIIRFATMRKLHRASGFAKEAEKDASSPWWNIGILLAMPAIWLAWSIILFLICIMSFVWLNGSTQNPIVGDLSPLAALGPRIGLTVIFFLGLTYFVLIVKTFYRYGAALDREWARTLADWAKAPPGMGTPGSFEKDTTAWGPRLISRGDGRNIYWAGSGPAPSG